MEFDLYRLINNNDINTLRLYLPDIAINIVPMSGITLLSYAAVKNRPEIVRLLLDLGADPNLQNYPGGPNALDYALYRLHGLSIPVIRGDGSRMIYRNQLPLDIGEIRTMELTIDILERYGGIPAITTQDPGVAAQAWNIYYGARGREDRDSGSSVDSNVSDPDLEALKSEAAINIQRMIRGRQSRQRSGQYIPPVGGLLEKLEELKESKEEEAREYNSRLREMVEGYNIEEWFRILRRENPIQGRLELLRRNSGLEEPALNDLERTRRYLDYNRALDADDELRGYSIVREYPELHPSYKYKSEPEYNPRMPQSSRKYAKRSKRRSKRRYR